MALWVNTFNYLMHYDAKGHFLYFRRTLYYFGVKVLCIEPGFFKTNVTDVDLHIRNVRKLWEKLPEETKEEYGHDYCDKGTCLMCAFMNLRL